MTNSENSNEPIEGKSIKVKKIPIKKPIEEKNGF
jgi:hypothetical protein